MRIKVLVWQLHPTDYIKILVLANSYSHLPYRVTTTAFDSPGTTEQEL